MYVPKRPLTSHPLPFLVQQHPLVHLFRRAVECETPQARWASSLYNAEQLLLAGFDTPSYSRYCVCQ